MDRSTAILVTLVTLFIAACTTEPTTPDEAHRRLRDRGLAELENERPGEAADTFRELSTALPEEPSNHANLAIALLREQDLTAALEAAQEASRLAPKDPRVESIHAEVLHWAGDIEGALARFVRAAEGAPDDLEIQFRLLEQAGQLGSAAAESAGAAALDRLIELRPENLVVLLAAGRRALEADDRTAASGAYLRIGELLWQASDPAPELLDRVLHGLESGEVASSLGPAQGLENVLKITPMYQQGLRELRTGIQGIPLERFAGEAPNRAFGTPASLDFEVETLAAEPTAAGGLAVADFDRDDRSEIVWRAADGRLTLIDPDEPAPTPWESSAPAGSGPVWALDIDNSGYPDLLTASPAGSTFRLDPGAVVPTPAASGYALPALDLRAAAPIDHDIEGDLDLAIAIGGEPHLELLRNSLDGRLEPVGDRAFAGLTIAPSRRIVASDYDRDGDLDLLLFGAEGAQALTNLRQGEFALDREATGSASSSPAVDGASADLDNDGWPDLLLLSAESLAWRANRDGIFDPPQAIDLPATASAGVGELHAIVALDADADGRLDVAVAGEAGVVLLQQGADGRFTAVRVSDHPAHTLANLDFDRDGDEDLIAAGGGGIWLLRSRGAEDRSWLRVRLRGLQKGSSKNNALGIGSTLEIRSGDAYQFREVAGDVTHFGLGAEEGADVLRVVWTNGVPQNRLDVAADRSIVEEQLLKGSCPFVYAWNGERIEFVTDLLWGAPAGLPVAPGVWAGADPTELVHLPDARPRNGVYDVRITEELWEAAFFDLNRLWIVDHPADVEVASNLAIGSTAGHEDRVLGTRSPQPLAAAWDASLDDVTSRVAERDEIYADGWKPSRYQGVTAEPWRFTLDLGRAPASPVRLLLDGWIFPSDASLNLAIAQRADAPTGGTRLEVETANGWQVLMPTLPFPAGKTKTMIVDTPPLPAGSRRLRIVSTLWLSWDRIRWSTEPADEAVRVVARLDAASAELRARGFSRMVRRAPNAPHAFDYAAVRTASPWLSFPGSYTRFGDVRELLAEPDDRMVILAPGDEMALSFAVEGLAPPADDRRRSVFLESHGWDKDADRNTWRAATMEPLPFRAMSGYPYGPGESYPDTPFHRRYRRDWLTRRID